MISRERQCDCAFCMTNRSLLALLPTPCFTARRVCSMPPPSSALSSIPPPIPVDAYPYRAPGSKSPEERIPDPDRLAPEDAYFAPSLARTRHAPGNYDEGLSLSSDGTAVASLQPPRGALGVDPSRKDVRKLGGGGGRRRRKGAWKKLLWVKQSCMEADCPQVLSEV